MSVFKNGKLAGGPGSTDPWRPDAEARTTGGVGSESRGRGMIELNRGTTVEVPAAAAASSVAVAAATWQKPWREVL